MRVSIARALITRPKLLLMDEPFAALDEITRFKLNDDLLHLWETFGWTVIFVTHSVFESVYLSNRIVVMAARPGRVFADMPIDAPYPRDEEFRTSADYNEYCRQISDALHGAMDGDDGRTMTAVEAEQPPSRHATVPEDEAPPPPPPHGEPRRARAPHPHPDRHARLLVVGWQV